MNFVGMLMTKKLPGTRSYPRATTQQGLTACLQASACTVTQTEACTRIEGRHREHCMRCLPGSAGGGTCCAVIVCCNPCVHYCGSHPASQSAGQPASQPAIPAGGSQRGLRETERERGSSCALCHTRMKPDVSETATTLHGREERKGRKGGGGGGGGGRGGGGAS